MRNLSTLASVAVLGLAGCGHSPNGGAPGSAPTFTISAPTVTTTIKQNSRVSVSLAVNRASDFKQTIHLTASAPAHITTEFNKATITAAEIGNFEMTITVGKDAPPGEQNITVTGTPDGGTSASVKVRINVESISDKKPRDRVEKNP